MFLARSMEYRQEYKHLTQKPELCSVTVLAMIALRREIWLDPEDLAKELNLKVTPDVAESFETHFGTSTDISQDGYDVDKIDVNALTKLMQHHGLHLQASFFPITSIKDIGAFLKDRIAAGNDVAMLFLLEPMGFDEKPWAHYVLVDAFDTENEIVEVCDPEASHKSHWKAPLQKFVKAMGPDFDGKERGFLVFERFEQ